PPHALGVERREPAAEHVAHEVRLRLPVEVDRAGIRGRRRPDLAQRGGRDAVLREQPLGGVEDPLARVAACQSRTAPGLQLGQSTKRQYPRRLADRQRASATIDGDAPANALRSKSPYSEISSNPARASRCSTSKR